MSMLTQKQAAEIRACVAGFLKEQGFERAFHEYITEAGLENENLDFAKLNNELETKFFMVTRMQIKINNLEKQLAEATKNSGINPLAQPSNNENALPRLPELHTFSGHRGAVNCVLFHPIYSFLVTASDDSTIKLWDVEKGKCERTLSGHTDAVNDLAFSPDGKLLASCSNDMYVKIWEMTESFDCSKTFAGHEHSISSVAFVRNTALLTGSRDHCIKLWDLTTVTCIQVYRDNSWIRMVRLHSEAKYFASAGSDHVVRIWEVEGGDQLVELMEHTNVVETLTWAPVAVADELKLKNSTFDDSGVYPNVYIEGKPLVLASGARDSTIRIWHVNTRHCLFTINEHTNWIHGLVWHPNGKTLISVSDDKTLRVWNVTSNFTPMKMLTPHKNFIRCLAIDAHGTCIATGCSDHTVKAFPCR